MYSILMGDFNGNFTMNMLLNLMGSFNGHFNGDVYSSDTLIIYDRNTVAMA